MVLKATKQDCFDFKYDKFLKDMRSTSWNSSASEGGKVFKFEYFYFYLILTIIFFKIKDVSGRIKLAPSLVITSLRI